MKSFTPELCRAARGLLAWGQRELAQRANVAHKTIADFELGVRRPYERTLKDVMAALEAGGVVFIEPEANVHATGIALRCDIATRMQKPQGKDDGTADDSPSIKAWDAALDVGGIMISGETASAPKILDQGAHWTAHPERSAKLSTAGMAALTKQLRLQGR